MQIARLGRRVRSEREARGWTLEQAAEKFAVEPAHVRRLEAAKANPTLSVLVSVASALGTTPTELLASDRPTAGGQGSGRGDLVRLAVIERLEALREKGIDAGFAAAFSEGGVDAFWAAMRDDGDEALVALMTAALSMISSGKSEEALRFLDAALAVARAAKVFGR